MRCFFIFLFLSPVFLFPNSLIIGIGGPSGSGKTTFSEQLKRKMKQSSVLVSMDNYFRDLSHLPPEERQKYNFDDPKAIDLELLREHLVKLKKELPIEQPIYDFKTKTRLESSLHTNPATIILLDGFLVLALTEIRELCDLKIYIESKECDCLFRVIDRDQKERGFSVEEIHRRYMDYVQPCYRQYIDESKYTADLIIPRGKDNETALKVILSLLKNGASLDL